MKKKSTFLNGISDLIADNTNVCPLLESMKEVEISHTNSDQEEMMSFVNGLKVPLGGTHVTGFRLSMTKIFTEFIKKK